MQRVCAGTVGAVRVLHAKLASDLVTLPILNPTPHSQVCAAMYQVLLILSILCYCFNSQPCCQYLPPLFVAGGGARIGALAHTPWQVVAR